MRNSLKEPLIGTFNFKKIIIYNLKKKKKNRRKRVMIITAFDLFLQKEE